jgi:hypothetical protein
MCNSYDANGKIPTQVALFIQAGLDSALRLLAYPQKKPLLPQNVLTRPGIQGILIL